MSRAPISGLVEYTRLETRFHDRFTEHIYQEAGQTGDQRKLVRKEHWEYQKLLGQGAHGCVWQEKCVQGQEIKVRAVKMIRKFKPQKPWESTNYTRELETVARFSHPVYEPYFVKSFGWYESQEAVFIAMEFLTHGNLQTHLNLIPRLLEPEAREISFQILEALHCMHNHGFAHRDLKPANILIKSMPPDRWWVKVCDFGISKNLQDSITESTMKGTMQYMAPELLDPVEDSHSRNGQAADIWALGEIISRMLTGEPTFKSHLAFWNFAQNSEGFPVDRLRTNGIESHICEFIMGLMIARPEDRMTSKDALRTKWMDIYETPSLDPPVSQSHGTTLFQRPAFLAENCHVLESTLDWTAVSNIAHRSPTAKSNSDGLAKESKLQGDPLSPGGVKMCPLGSFDLRRSRPLNRSPAHSEGQFGAEIDPYAFYQRQNKPILVPPSKRLQAHRRATSHSNSLLANPTNPVPQSTKPMSYERGSSPSRGPRKSIEKRSSWHGTESGPRPVTPDQQVCNRWDQSPKIVTSPQSDIFPAQRDRFSDSGVDISSQETFQSYDSGLRASSSKADSMLASSSISSLAVQVSQSSVEREKECEQEPEWEDERERSSLRTAYRDGIRRDICARRKRRKEATRYMVEQATVKGDLKAKEHAKMVELSGDAVFEFRLSIWFASLPSHQLHADVRDVLKRLNIIYAVTDQVYECWYSPASEPTRNGDGEERSVRPKGGYTHFELAFWKKRAMLVVSDTYFRFKKLEGNIGDYENLVERLVDTFEKNWHSKTEYPQY